MKIKVISLVLILTVVVSGIILKQTKFNPCNAVKKAYLSEYDVKWKTMMNSASKKWESFPLTGDGSMRVVKDIFGSEYKYDKNDFIGWFNTNYREEKIKLWDFAARLIVNSPSCFKPDEVVYSQSYLANKTSSH